MVMTNHLLLVGLISDPPGTALMVGTNCIEVETTRLAWKHYDVRRTTIEHISVCVVVGSDLLIDFWF